MVVNWSNENTLLLEQDQKDRKRILGEYGQYANHLQIIYFYLRLLAIFSRLVLTTADIVVYWVEFYFGRELMNKINDKQKKIIEFFRTQLGFWENTNDIDSLTHYSDIGEELSVLNNKLLTADEYDRIESVARILYQTIKTIKDE